MVGEVISSAGFTIIRNCLCSSHSGTPASAIVRFARRWAGGGATFGGCGVAFATTGGGAGCGNKGRRGLLNHWAANQVCHLSSQGSGVAGATVLHFGQATGSPSATRTGKRSSQFGQRGRNVGSLLTRDL